MNAADLELIQDLGDLLEDLAAEPGDSIRLVLYAERMGALRARVREALTAARRAGFPDDFPAQVDATADVRRQVPYLAHLAHLGVFNVSGDEPEYDPRANYRYEVFDDGRLVDRCKSLARAFGIARGRAKGNVDDRELGTSGMEVADHRGRVPLTRRYESHALEDRDR